MTTDALEWVADPFRTRFEWRADGALLLQPQGSPPEYPARLMDFLEHWARVAPDHDCDVPAAITLHPVAEQAHGFEVILIDSDSKRGHVASSVSHEDWHDLLEIRID